MTESPPSSGGAPRRGFLFQFTTGLIATIVGVVPAIAAAVFALNPLMKKKDDGEDKGDGFVSLRVTKQALAKGGPPRAVKVVDDKVDAWNKFKDVEIGTVWLRRTDNDEVIAFNTICPHLGCAIDFRHSENDFYCPCHTSKFSLDGAKQNQIPPRNMDRLELREDEETGELWLKYESFRAATPEKVPV